MISTPSKKYSFDMVYDSQKVFRLILEAMSNPTRAVNIKEHGDKLYGDYPAMLAIAMTLLDNEVTFSTSGSRLLSDAFASATHAKRETIGSADYVFICGSCDLNSVIENVKCGTLSDPHKSATVIIHNDGAPLFRMTLTGPGIDGQASMQATKTVKDTLALRDAQNYEYPMGIDLIFVSGEGELFAIPRLIRTVVE